MGLGPRLDIRQSQSLVLKPQLTQAIKLLQLSKLELETFIQEELSKNPLLECRGGEDEGGDGDVDTAALSPGGEAFEDAPDDPGAD